MLAALFLRFVVPAGFMPAIEDGRLTLVVCSGYGAVMPSPAASGHAMPAMDHHAAAMPDMQHGGDDAGHWQNPCAFADLSLPVIGGADPVQLAAALIFIVAAALFVVSALPRLAALRLRPPLRGPPATV